MIVSALMLAVALIGASYFLAQSIERSAETVGRLAGRLDSLPTAAAPSKPAAPGRPDPAQRYEIDLGSAPVKGPADASVTIVEWSDFQCPYCRRVAPTLEQIQNAYGDDVRIAFKHLPLPMHAQAEPAHIAAEAAHRQGKFWEMHDRIFSNPRELNSAKFLQYAEEIGLDLDRFKADIASEAVKQQVRQDAAQAAKLNVTGTPAFFINGRFLPGAQPFTRFKQVIDEELKQKQG